MRERERERETGGQRRGGGESPLKRFAYESGPLTPYPENTAPSGKCRDAQGAWGSTLGTRSDSQPRESSHGKFLVLDLGFGVGFVRVLGLELAPTINQWVNHPKVRSRFLCLVCLEILFMRRVRRVIDIASQVWAFTKDFQQGCAAGESIMHMPQTLNSKP